MAFLKWSELALAEGGNPGLLKSIGGSGFRWLEPIVPWKKLSFQSISLLKYLRTKKNLEFFF
jgi:hypothetical protein